ncbi:MAG: heterodisulfide reductase-related iron-sulfur binding cluster, partial [bacterium]
AQRMDPLIRIAYPLRNLAVSEKVTKNPVFFTPCPHCFRTFSETRAFMADGDSEIKTKALSAIGLPYSGKTEIKNILQVFEDHQAAQKIKKFLLRNLGGLKVVCYYGCKLTRPASFVPDLGDPERITIMEKYIKMAGGEALPWRHAFTCNGSYLAQGEPDQGLKMVAEILMEAKRVGAECIVVSCPVCFYNLDGLQRDAFRAFGQRDEIPVFYLSELLALAMGTPITKLDMAHAVKPDPVLKKIGLLQSAKK